MTPFTNTTFRQFCSSVLFPGIMLLISGTAAAQDAISKYLSELNNDPDYTSIVISSKMFSMFSDLKASDPEDKEMLDMLSDLSGIKIISNDELQNGSQVMRSALSKLGSDYQVLMSVKDKDQNIRFYVKERPDKKISELLMLVGGETNFFAMSITGIIDLQKIAQLSEGMNVSGLNYLNNLDKKEGGK